MGLVRKIAGELSKGIVEGKCFSGRVRNKGVGVECWVGIVWCGSGEEGLVGIFVGLGSKNVKIVIGCLECLEVAVRGFGVGEVFGKGGLEGFGGLVGGLLEHGNGKVREGCRRVVVGLFRWIGRGVEGILGGVVEVTRKKLEAGFGECKGKVKAERLTRKQMETMEVRGGEGVGEEEDSEEDGEDEDEPQEEVDLRKEVDVMELLPTLKVTVEEGVVKPWSVAIESKKWKARKDALEVLLEAVGDSRLVPGPHIELVVALRKIFAADKNVTVVERACKVVMLLANGLRAKFPPQQAKDLTKDLISRLKEKNSTLIRAVNAALDTVFQQKVIELHTIVDDIAIAAEHKVPKARIELLQWLARCLETGVPTSTLKGKPLETLASTLLKLSEDSAAEARDASLICIASLTNIVGERDMKMYLDKIEKIRRDKITTLLSKMPPKKEERRKAKKKNEKEAPVEIPSSGNTKETDKPKETAKARKPPPVVQNPNVSVPIAKTKADVDPEAAARFAPEKIEGFTMDNWSAKQASARTSCGEMLFNYLGEQEKLSPLDVNMAIGLLLTAPSLDDTNFRAVKAKLDVFGCIADKAAYPLPKEPLGTLLSKAVAKLGDIKFGIATTGVLMSVAEAASVGFVFSTLAESVPNAKNARAQTAMLDFASKLVEEFGSAAVTTDSPLTLAMTLASSETAALRKAALGLAARVAVRTQVEDVRNKLTEGNVASEHLTYFDGECTKHSQNLEEAKRTEKVWEEPVVASSGEPEPSTSKTSDDHNGVAGFEAKEKDAQSPPASEGPIDISKEVTKTQLITDLSSRNWKVRQNALNALDELIKEAKNGIEGEVGPDLMPALTARLSDSNRNLAAFAYALMGRLVKSMGASATLHAETVLPTIFGSGCIDIKPRVREVALKCLEEWCTCIGLTPMMPYLAMPTATVSSICRKDYLEWLLPWLRGEKGDFSSKMEDLSILINPCLSCLQDKIGQVRQLAEWVLEQVVRSVGFPAVEGKMRNFSPSVRMQLDSALDKFRGLNGASAKKSVSNASRRKIPGGSRVKSVRSRRSGIAPAGKSPGHRYSGRASPQSSSSVASNSRKPPKTPKRGRVGGIERISGMERSPQSSPQSSSRVEKAFRADGDRDARASQVRIYREEHASGILEEQHGYLPFVPENLTLLGDDLKSCVSRSLFSKMMAPANRFQQHADAVLLLNEAMQDDPDGVIPIADVLLRWAAYRINDIKTPSTLIIKISELVKNICEVLQSNGTRLSAYEALAIVPVLADRCGSNRDAVRTAALSALQSVEDLLDDALALVYLAEGMRLTRNSRAKVVVAAETEEAMNRLSVEMEALPVSVLQAIAEVAAGVDDLAGCAASRCIDRAHHQFGDEVLTRLGPLSEEQSMIIQRRLESIGGISQAQIRSTVPEYSAQNGGRDQLRHGNVLSPAVPVQVRSEDFRLSIAPSPPRTARNFGKFAHNKAFLETPIRTRRQLAVELLHEATPVPSRYPTSNASPVRGASGTPASNAQAAIDLLKTADRMSCTQGLEILFEDLNQTHSILINNRASEVIPLLCRGFRDCFERLELHSAPSDEPSLLKRYLNALMSFARIPEVIQSVEQIVIERFLNDLLDTLVPPDVPDVVDWERVRRGINLVVLKILDFCDRNVLFSSLLNILLMDLRMPREEEIISSAKSNLCLKCISKVVRRGFKNVDIDKLLRDVHLFITAYPPSRSLDGTSDQQQSLRLLKIVLDSLIQFKGERILGNLTLVPSDDSTPLVRFIKALLNKHGLRSGRDSPKTADLATVRNLSATSPALFAKKAVTPSRDNEVGFQSQLRKIFQRIRTRENNDVGLRQLKAFMRAHPEVDVNPHIQKCSDVFQQYIKEGLTRISNEESSVEVSDGKGNKTLESKENMGAGEDERLSESGKSTGQVYLARLRDIQVRYGLTGTKKQKGDENRESHKGSKLKENDEMPIGT